MSTSSPSPTSGTATRRRSDAMAAAAGQGTALLPAPPAQSAGVYLGATALSLTEGGTATCTVVLDTAPAAPYFVRHSMAAQFRARDDSISLKSSITLETFISSERRFPCAIWFRTS